MTWAMVNLVLINQTVTRQNGNMERRKGESRKQKGVALILYVFALLTLYDNKSMQLTK